MGESMQVQAAVVEAAVNTAQGAAVKDNTNLEQPDLGLVKEFLAFLNHDLASENAAPLGDQESETEVETETDQPSEGTEQALLQLLQNHPAMAAAVLMPMIAPPPQAEVPGDNPVQGTKMNLADLAAAMEALQDQPQGQAAVMEVSPVAVQSENPQVLKRDQTGVHGMLNDFPQGWESLLDDNAVAETSGPLPEPGALEQVKAGAMTMTVMPSGAEAESPGSGLTLENLDSEQETFTFLAGKEGGGTKHAAVEKTSMEPTFTENAMFSMPGRSLGLDATLSPSGAGTLQLLKAMNEVQQQSVIKSFSQEVVKGAKGKEEKLHIELNPPELGRVQVTVHRSGDQIHAKVFMADKHLGEFFQDNLDQIKKNLESAGVKVGTFSLEVGQQQQQAGQGPVNKQDQEEQGWSAQPKGLSVSETTPTGSGDRAGRWKTSKVDMLI